MDLDCFGMTPVGCKKSKIQLISFSLPATNLVFVCKSLACGWKFTFVTRETKHMCCGAPGGARTQTTTAACHRGWVSNEARCAKITG